MERGVGFVRIGKSKSLNNWRELRSIDKEE